MALHPLTFWQEAAASGIDQTHWLELDGSTQYATAADSASLSPTGDDLTFEIRWKTPASLSGSYCLIHKEDAYQVLYAHTNGQLYLYTWNSTADRHAYRTNVSGGLTGSGLAASTEYHLAVTHDSSGTNTTCKKFYLNGTEITDLALVDGATAFDIADNGNTVYLGVTSALGNDLEGEIADVRIWDDVRTGTEINDNKAVNVDPTSEANLVALYYKTNSHDDETSNGNNLTPTGSPTFNVYDGVTYT